jgi:poly(A) polymerase
VNAKLTGNAGGDGLTSGRCPTGKWLTLPSSHVKVLSINVYGVDGARKDDRTAAILELVKKTDAEFVAFQEAEAWFIKTLTNDPFIKSYYQWTDYGNQRAPGGLFTISKLKINHVKYSEQTMPGQVEETQRGRVLTIEVLIGERCVTVANTWLDWRSAENRVNSMNFIFSVLEHEDDVILMGDFNFDFAAEPESASLPQSYVDVWSQLRPNDPGFTWNPLTNSYAKLADSSSRPSRIDRIFVKSSQWLAMSTKLVGCSTIDLMCETPSTQALQLKVPDVPSAYPSTHYGVYVELTRFSPHC